jgi:hypothetical protein
MFLILADGNFSVVKFHLHIAASPRTGGLSVKINAESKEEKSFERVLKQFHIRTFHDIEMLEQTFRRYKNTGRKTSREKEQMSTAQPLL